MLSIRQIPVYPLHLIPFSSLSFLGLCAILWFIQISQSFKHSLSTYNIPGTLLVWVQRFKVPEEFNHLAEERDQQEESVWGNQREEKNTLPLP